MYNESKSRSFRHCHLCGHRLWGGGWTYALNGVPDGQSLVVCRRCQETAPRCDVCGVPMNANHIQLPDGRRTCTRCHETAVYDPAHARSLFERVTRIVTDELGLGLNIGTDFTLADDRHLQRLAADVPPGPDEGAARDPGSRVIGLFIRQGRMRVMAVLSGLPQILLIQTIAHEWAHAWQGENCPLLKDPLIREGFAEWAAYKTLQKMGAVKKTALMERHNGLYGEGLQRMLELEQRAGVSGVLDFCRRAE